MWQIFFNERTSWHGTFHRVANPGTTRDYIEQYTVLGKIPVNVVDTAGLRHTDDPLNKKA